MKKFAKEYLRFSRKERIGIVCLLLLITGFLVLPEIYPVTHSPLQADTALLRLFTNDTSTVSPESLGTPDLRRVRYFYFDPNTITENEWQQLGLPSKTIRTILNYRNKGGVFKQSNDLRKIWGLTALQADSLVPYVRIVHKALAEADHKIFYAPKRAGIHLSPKPFKVIDINTADAAQWESLPGIGTVLAGRIIKYRTKLGGFANIEQVQKTYGISDTVFQLIKPLLKVVAINIAQHTLLSNASINNASVAELKAIGIREDIAEAIVLYRKQNGAYQKMEDLKKIIFLTEGLYQSILPLLRL